RPEAPPRAPGGRAGGRAVPHPHGGADRRRRRAVDPRRRPAAGREGPAAAFGPPGPGPALASVRRLGSAPMPIRGGGRLVAGAGSGLGAGAARRAPAAGARLAIADLNAEKGAALAEELDAQFVQTDVTNAEQVAAAVETAGELRISVCCAGIGWAER